MLEKFEKNPYVRYRSSPNEKWQAGIVHKISHNIDKVYILLQDGSECSVDVSLHEDLQVVEIDSTSYLGELKEAVGFIRSLLSKISPEYAYAHQSEISAAQHFALKCQDIFIERLESQLE